MRRLVLLMLLGTAAAAGGETVSVCFNYGCVAQAEVRYDEKQLGRVRTFLAAAESAGEERARLSLAVGWLLAWAGEQAPIAADRGGNYADDGVFGRMDCIDHSITTTRLLQLLEVRGWLRFHRVLEPVQRTRYLFEHHSAQIEELAPIVDASDDPAAAAEPVRHVVDSWFRANGQPAVVIPLPAWLAGEGGVEEGAITAVLDGPEHGPNFEGY